MRSILMAMVLSIGLPGAAFPSERTVTLAVEKMHCALCPVTVGKAIEKVEGVVSVDVDFETKTAVVMFDDTVTDWQALAAASTSAGYPATLNGQ